jgi:uncharacterized protein YbbK (DUF523 family)
MFFLGIKMKKKVIISACLLGELCRYDGKTKQDSAVLGHFKDYDIIPFCPEAPVFGTPRERINVMQIDGEKRIVTDVTCNDVTQVLAQEINNFMASHPKVDAIVLKSKSPSCGYNTTPILNEKKEQISFGSGLAAQMMEDFYEKIPIKDENNYLKSPAK